MKTFAMTAALLALAGIARADGVNWETSYANGLAEAKKSGKLLHVHFAADWCGPCKAMDRELFHDADAAKYLNDTFVNVLIDVDKDPDTAKKFKVSGIPDSRVVDAGEKEILRSVGYPSKLLDQMKSIGEVSKVQKMLADKPGDPATAIAASEIYARLGGDKLEEAGKFLEKAIEGDPEDKSGKLVELWYRLGLVNQKAGRADEAEEAWARVGKMDPNNTKGFIDDIQFARVQKQADEEDWGSAERSVTEFLKQFSESERVADAKFLLGAAQFYNEKNDEAISTWKDLIRAHPDTPAAKKAQIGLAAAEKKKAKRSQ